MKQIETSLKSALISLWFNRHLIKNLGYRDVVARYKGSYVGILWTILNPLIMVSIYTFIFGFILKSKWGNSSEYSVAEYSLVLFLGLIIFNFFSECVTRAPTIILVNSNFVKKFIFPLEIFPFVILGSAIFHGLISFSVWFVFYLIFFGKINLISILFPIIFMPLVFMLAGIMWILSSLGVYLRDINQFIGVLCQIMLFVSPIFYSADALPENYRWVMSINPLSLIINQSRDVLIFNIFPDIGALFIYYLISFLVAWIGYVFFQKTRRGFAGAL